MRNIKLGVLSETHDYTLLVRVDEETLEISAGDPTPYIVAYGYDNTTKTWCQGHYFDDITEAVEWVGAITTRKVGAITRKAGFKTRG